MFRRLFRAIGALLSVRDVPSPLHVCPCTAVLHVCAEPSCRHYDRVLRSSGHCCSSSESLGWLFSGMYSKCWSHIDRRRTTSKVTRWSGEKRIRLKWTYEKLTNTHSFIFIVHFDGCFIHSPADRWVPEMRRMKSGIGRSQLELTFRWRKSSELIAGRYMFDSSNSSHTLWFRRLTRLTVNYALVHSLEFNERWSWSHALHAAVEFTRSLPMSFPCYFNSANIVCLHETSIYTHTKSLFQQIGT